MDQDATWYGGRVGLGPGDIELDGTQLPSPRKGAHQWPVPPLFGPCLLWPNGWMDQDSTWYGGRPRPRRHCVRWRPSSPTEKGHSSPHCSAHVYCGQTVAHLSNRWPIVWDRRGCVCCQQWRHHAPVPVIIPANRLTYNGLSTASTVRRRSTLPGACRKTVTVLFSQYYTVPCQRIQTKFGTSSQFFWPFKPTLRNFVTDHFAALRLVHIWHICYYGLYKWIFVMFTWLLASDVVELSWPVRTLSLIVESEMPVL